MLHLFGWALLFGFLHGLRAWMLERLRHDRTP